jgi:hypothetical protein
MNRGELRRGKQVERNFIKAKVKTICIAEESISEKHLVNGAYVLIIYHPQHNTRPRGAFLRFGGEANVVLEIR